MDDVVDPAHAGMILYYIRPDCPVYCGPRACGDDPLDNVLDKAIEAWTPRMRG